MTMPEDRAGRGRRRFGRTTLVFAAALTTAMFGWQGYHLYESQRAVAERDAGECPTRAVEAAYSAGERLDYLTDEIEHSVILWGPSLAASPLPNLAARYGDTEAQLDEALDQATSLAKGKVLAAVEELAAAHGQLDTQVDEVLRLAAGGDAAAATAAIAGAEFVQLRDTYSAALDEMWTARREHLIKQLERERRAEVISVSVALVLFALAVGAWGLFIRQIRRGQIRLQEEELQRQRAEQDLIQAQKMDALGLMAGGIAHDFNNLVTAIWGSASSAKSQLGSGHPAAAALERIEDASEQANGVVRALLTFSRKADSVKAPVEIGTLIDSTARILETMFPAAVEVVTDHPTGVLWVYGDATQLQQAFMNLGLNASEAMPDGGRITFCAFPCTESPDGLPRVVVEVSDTGEGIGPDIIDRVFEPFFTTRAPGQGTGLGLSIIHGIVTDHNGRIQVESEPGNGASFIIDLPGIEPPVAAADTAAPTGARTHHHDELVLLVEDHQHVREIIAETLETAGFRVIQAASGEEFLDRFAHTAEPIRLLIVDVDIPPPNGVECILRIRRQGADTPAMVITGTTASGLEDSLDGLAFVLRKPFTMTRLLEVASTLVESAPV